MTIGVVLVVAAVTSASIFTFWYNVESEGTVNQMWEISEDGSTWSELGDTSKTFDINGFGGDSDSYSFWLRLNNAVSGSKDLQFDISETPELNITLDNAGIEIYNGDTWTFLPGDNNQQFNYTISISPMSSSGTYNAELLIISP